MSNNNEDTKYYTIARYPMADKPETLWKLSANDPSVIEEILDAISDALDVLSMRDDFNEENMAKHRALLDDIRQRTVYELNPPMTYVQEDEVTMLLGLMVEFARMSAMFAEIAEEQKEALQAYREIIEEQTEIITMLREKHGKKRVDTVANSSGYLQ